jgi:hypothetical protein
LHGFLIGLLPFGLMTLIVVRQRIFIQRKFNGIEQSAAGKRLPEIGHAVRGGCAGARFQFIMGRDEGQGQVGARLLELPLQLKARHAGKLDVGDDEASKVLAGIGQESFSGKVTSNVVTGHSQKAAQ